MCQTFCRPCPGRGLIFIPSSCASSFCCALHIFVCSANSRLLWLTPDLQDNHSITEERRWLAVANKPVLSDTSSWFGEGEVNVLGILSCGQGGYPTCSVMVLVIMQTANRVRGVIRREQGNRGGTDCRDKKASRLFGWLFAISGRWGINRPADRGWRRWRSSPSQRQIRC